jgi:frataxin-like iron-binding protein CyaY
MKENSDFKRHAEEALTGLHRRLAAAGDDFGFEASLDSGILTIDFESKAEPVHVVPNAASGQIWVKCGTQKQKLGWDIVENAFILELTGQTLQEVLEETIGRLVGDDVNL